MSLFDRIQGRLKNAEHCNTLNEAPKLSDKVVFSDTSNSDEESDIDDNITIGDLETKDGSNKEIFTKLKKREISSENTSLSNIIKNQISKQKASNIVNVSNRELYENNYKEEITYECNSLISNNDIYTGHFDVEKRILEDSSSTVINKIISDTSSCTHTNEISKQAEISPKLKKKRKLTDEERQAAKELKETEKIRKEQLRKEAKLSKEREKALKKVETLNSKMLKKEQCLQKLLVAIDRNIVESPCGANILDSFQKTSIQYEVKDLALPFCMAWLRERDAFKVGASSEVVKESHYEEEPHILYIMTAIYLAQLIDAEIRNSHEEETLKSLHQNIKFVFPRKRITFLITGMNKYHNLVKTKQNQMFRSKCHEENTNQQKKNRKKKELNIPLLSKDDIDQAITALEITTNVTVRMWEEELTLGTFVYSFTKAIGEAPTKQEYHTALQFRGTTDMACIKLTEQRHGMLQLWNQQLQQFYGVRQDTSVAITQVYPTPLALMKAYENLSEKEGKMLLEDIMVRRGVGVLQSNRRVGPELSKKIYKLFTSTDGDEDVAR